MKTALDLVRNAKALITEVPISQAQAACQQADIIIDVREPAEYAAGHIKGAVSVPRGVLEFKIADLPAIKGADTHIMLYCKTSGRAALAACAMQDMGYLNVRSIAGGFDAWAVAGKPVARPELPSFE